MSAIRPNSGVAVLAPIAGIVARDYAAAQGNLARFGFGSHSITREPVDQIHKRPLATIWALATDGRSPRRELTNVESHPYRAVVGIARYISLPLVQAASIGVADEYTQSHAR